MQIPACLWVACANVIFANANRETITFIDTFDDGSLVYGHKSVVNDFAELAEDSEGSLPESFSICSSVKIEALTTIQSFFQVGLSPKAIE